MWIAVLRVSVLSLLLVFALGACAGTAESEAKVQSDGPSPVSKVGVASATDPRAVMTSGAKAVLKQVYPCWSPPVFAPVSESPVVVLRLLFGPKGEVQRAEVLNEESDPLVIQLRVDVSPEGEVRRVEFPEEDKAAVDPFFQASAESVIRAVKRCSPVELPSRDYAVWREMVLVFDPRLLIGQ